jgi:hypothetical protein
MHEARLKQVLAMILAVAVAFSIMNWTIRNAAGNGCEPPGRAPGLGGLAVTRDGAKAYSAR